MLQSFLILSTVIGILWFIVWWLKMMDEHGSFSDWRKSKCKHLSIIYAFSHYEWKCKAAIHGECFFCGKIVFVTTLGQCVHPIAPRDESYYYLVRERFRWMESKTSAEEGQRKVVMPQ